MSNIKISIGTSTSRTTIIAPDSKTPKQILDENNIKFQTSQILLDGVALTVAELNTSMKDLGVVESAYLVAATKTSNA